MMITNLFMLYDNQFNLLELTTSYDTFKKAMADAKRDKVQFTATVNAVVVHRPVG